jgi:hypothetical protein
LGISLSLNSLFQSLIDLIHHVGDSDLFPVFFGEYCVTHERREEFLNGFDCLPVSLDVQVIDDFLEFLLIPAGLFQALGNLFLVFLGMFFSKGLLVQRTKDICQDALREGVSAVFWIPVWSSEMTN